MDWCANWWWLFTLLSILSGLIGWYLHQFFDEQKILDKDDQIKDRDQRYQSLFNDYNSLSINKNDSINALHIEKDSLLEQLTQERRKVAQLKIDSVPTPTIINPLVSNTVSPTLHEELSRLKDENLYLKSEIEYQSAVKANDDSISLKRDFEKRTKKYRKLKNKYDLLVIDYNELIEKSKSSNGKEQIDKTVIKEIPIEITKEVRIRERIDYKKLKKLIDENLPLLKTKKTVKTSKKKGKAKIINPS